MILYVAILVSLSLVHGAPQLNPLLNGKIVGGHDVTIQEHPHQVSIQLFGGHYCGGSLISNTFIVTAAHCSRYNPEDYVVRLGSDKMSSGGVLVNVKAITPHPDYGIIAHSNDISIFELAEPVEYSESIQPIALPTADELLEDGTVVTVTGFGDTSEGSGAGSEQLQGVEVVKISNEDCQQSYSDEEITDSMVCANVEGGGKDSCQGDSGGPLTANSKLFGIVSWGYGCAEAPYPGVYGYVPPLRSFITEVTGL